MTSGVGTSARRRYIAYGLGIRSPMPLDELCAGEAGADVGIRLDRVVPIAPASCEFASDAGDDETRLSWAGIGTFLVRWDEIVVDPAPGVDDALLRVFILGPVLACLLRQRGLCVLHASAVSLDSTAIALLGAAGRGKSTLAAALHARGFDLVADDAAAVEVSRAARPRVVPAYPQLKLWPDSAIAVGLTLDDLPRLDSRYQKRACALPLRFAAARTPLRRIYVIADGTAPAVEPLGRQETIVELLRHSYGARTLRAVRPSCHFLQLGELARSVSVHRLRIPRRLSALADVARLVEDDLARAS